MCHNWSKWVLVLWNFLASLYFINISFTKGDTRTLDGSLGTYSYYNTGVSTSSWVVKVPVKYENESWLRKDVDSIAEKLGLENQGQVGGLKGHYLLVHKPTFFNHTNFEDDGLRSLRRTISDVLLAHPGVEWSRQELVRMRYKRALQFKDQYFPNQWHLNNLRFIGHDINVTGVWEHNITGKGIVVSVIDDGVEWTNPDILDNYSPEGSWDINSNDDDPMPRADDPGLNHHGTRCAGEIAAVANTYCAVGVAYGAKVSGVRILDGPMTDSLEAMAFNTKLQINDIYSCSWGPDDNGKTVDGPHQLAQAALAHGVLIGRKGYGSIFVVASGNGGHYKDNCNFDGYANSIYTVTIGAVDELGNMPYYAERCASMLAVTYSSGQGMQRNIVTTDWRLGSGTGCTNKHTGTSAAAPLAAGMIALMLQVRPCLTWRDVQHLIAYTARKHDVDEDEWFTNGAGFHHSHKYGFGLLDSWRLVNAAKVWKNVPWMTSWSSPLLTVKKYIPSSTNQIIQTYTVKRSDVPHVVTLEHVTVTVNIAHRVRGNVLVSLTSPYGTPSELATARDHDRSFEGFEDWTFSTVRCWGEEPVGTWQLIVTDNGDIPFGKGFLKDWKLTFYGSSMSSLKVKKRHELVEKAASGILLNSNMTEPCPPPMKGFDEQAILSERALKILLLVSGFCFLVAIYYLVDVVLDSEENKEGVLLQPPRAPAQRHSQQPKGQNPGDSVVLDVDQQTKPFTVQSPLLPDKLIEQDKIRLSHLLEIGASRPHTPVESFPGRPTTPSTPPLFPIKHTPSPEDERMRMEEFEKRLRYAMEQSLNIQAKQMSEIDALEKELGRTKPEAAGPSSTPEQSRKNKKQGKVRKLKGILKKPKPKKNWTP